MSFISNLMLFLAINGLLVSHSAPVDKLTAKDITDKTEVTLRQAINIVEKRKLTDCVARAICQLSCDPEIFGPNGKSVYQTLRQFESDTLPQLAFYKGAKEKGQALPKTKCDDCVKLYSNCKTSTETLLRLANALTIKP